jgi:hypothetical protein
MPTYELQKDDPSHTGEALRLRDERSHDVAHILGETDPVVVKTLGWLLQQLGAAEVSILVAEALELEAAGGVWVVATQARRSLGGVFFALVKMRATRAFNAALFRRQQREVARGSEKALAAGEAALGDAVSALTPKGEENAWQLANAAKFCAARAKATDAWKARGTGGGPWEPRSIQCPTCGARVGEPCSATVTLHTRLDPRCQPRGKAPPPPRPPPAPEPEVLVRRRRPS